MGKIQLGIYAMTHFLVDLCCALLLLGKVCPDQDPMAAIFLYNLFAFAVQMPLGLLADRLGGSRLFAAGGCVLVLAGWLLPGLAAAVTAGLGNAAFHVGGGLFALNAEGHRAGPLGLFVSPGAFGVYLGGRYAASVFAPVSSVSGFLPILAAVLLLPAAAIILLFPNRESENAPLALPQGDVRLWGGAACLLAVVVLRSLLGLAAELPWKADAGIAVVCAVAGGKAVGGYLADRFGVKPVALASLGAAALCFLGCAHPAAGLAALFLFNMTMPLTLWAMAKIFPGAKGFSFGSLTFGLFLGFLPVYFGCGGMGAATLALWTAVSALLLDFGLRQAERGAAAKDRAEDEKDRTEGKKELTWG